MRISDWSSDVCSSDLLALAHRRMPAPHPGNQVRTAILPRLAGCRRRGSGFPALRFAGGVMNWSEEDLAADLASSESVELAFRKWCEPGPGRSEARRVGKACVSTCRFRLFPCL